MNYLKNLLNHTDIEAIDFDDLTIQDMIATVAKDIKKSNANDDIYLHISEMILNDVSRDELAQYDKEDIAHIAKMYCKQLDLKYYNQNLIADIVIMSI